MSTAPAEHKCFVARPTSRGWAVFFQPNPKSMSIPALIIGALISDAEGVAGDVAEVLNQHWPTTLTPTTPH